MTISRTERTQVAVGAICYLQLISRLKMMWHAGSSASLLPP